MSKQKIEIITRQGLAEMLTITKQAVSNAVNRDKKLRDTKYDGRTGINLYDPLTIQYVTELCSKKNIPIPAVFKEQKSDVQLFMEAVDNAWDQCVCSDCMDMKNDFQTAVVEYVKSEKG